MNEIVSNESEEAINSPGRLINGCLPLTREDLFAMLSEAGIDYEVFYHPPLRTVEEARAVRPKSDYGHTKNLFVRNKKGKMWLLTLHEDRGAKPKAPASRGFSQIRRKPCGSCLSASASESPPDCWTDYKPAAARRRCVSPAPCRASPAASSRLWDTEFL